MALDLNSIGSLLSGSGLSALSRRTKVNREDVAKVLSAGIPALVGGMRRNAGAQAGAESLSRALSDHSAADTSNPGEFLKNADLEDGRKILAHVRGDDQNELVEEISGATGVTRAKTTTILALVAPLLLSLLGSSNQSGSGGLFGMLGGLLGLGGSSQPTQTQQSSGGLLSGLLGGGQQPQPQQSTSLLGSLFGGSSNSNASLASGLFSSLLGGGSDAAEQNAQNTIQIVDNAQQQEESSSGGLLDSFLNLFH